MDLGTVSFKNNTSEPLNIDNIRLPLDFSTYADNAWTPKDHMDKITEEYNRPCITLVKSRKVGQTTILNSILGLKNRPYAGVNLAKQIAVPNLIIDTDALCGWGKLDAGSLPTQKQLTYVRNPYKEIGTPPHKIRPSITLKYNKN